MTSSERLMSTLFSVIGGAVGGFVGYKAFSWLYDHGYYGMMIPGGLLGLGCGMLARHSSQIRGVVAAVAGLLLGLFTEWQFFPFRADGSFSYLLTHVHQILSVHLLMIGLGGFFAYWLGKDGGWGRITPPKSAPTPRDVL